MSSLDTEDRLALFGYGLFETLRVDKKGVEVPELHYARMKDGSNMLGIAIPDYSLWLKNLISVIHERDNCIPYAVRVTLSGGSSNLDVGPSLFYSFRTIPYKSEHYINGVKICYFESPRNELSPLVRIKSTNYLENVLAKQEAEKRGALEGIWLNTKGFLSEGSMSNLFFVLDKTLCTPNLSCGCLPGTRRQIILQLARNLNIPVREENFLPQHLEQAQEVFLTNSLMGLLPVRQIDQIKKELSFTDSKSIYLRLSESFKAFVKNKKYSI